MYILSKIKIYSARMLLKVVQSKSYLILLNLSENSLKMEARIFTQEELDLKSQITDYPIIKRFEEIAGIEFDWSKFQNRREFRAYIKSLLNVE